MNNEECQHRTDSMCSCIGADSEHLISNDLLEALNHLTTHLTDDEWELHYATLDTPGLYRLCIVGTCGRCGGRLCMSIDESVGLTSDVLLTSLYRHLCLLNGKIGSHLTYPDFRERFVQLFHAPDQAFVRKWLERPENREMWRMLEATQETEVW